VTIKKIGQISADSVKKGTGHDWDFWIEKLTKSGARAWSHQEIVKVLASKFRLSLWWQQWVANGFEVQLGLRVEGANLKGRFAATVTKSLNCSASQVWKFVTSPRGQALWLNGLYAVKIAPKNFFETKDGYFGEIRTVKKANRIRLHWNHPEWERKSVVSLNVIARPKGRSLIYFQHDELISAQQKLEMRKHWELVFKRLVPVLISK